MPSIMKETVRAIIVDGKNILLIARIKSNDSYFIFPGGGVEEGEDHEQALIREVKEELGIDVRVRELIAQKPRQ